MSSNELVEACGKIDNVTDELEKKERELEKEKVEFRNHMNIRYLKSTKVMKIKRRNPSVNEKKGMIKKAPFSFRTVIAHKNQKIHSQKNELEKREKEIEKYKIDAEATSKEIAMKNAKERRDYLIAELQKMTEKLVKENTSINCVLKGITETTIRARFTQISKLTSIYTHSHSAKVAGMDWAILICSTMDNSTKYLSAYIQITSSHIPISWSCTGFFTMKLIRQSFKDEPYTTESYGTIFSLEHRGWGRSNFISFEELENPLNDYIKDDSIIMEIHLKAYPVK